MQDIAHILYYVFLGTIILVSGVGFWYRRRLTESNTLLLTCTLLLCILIGVPSGFYAWAGPDFVKKGDLNPRLTSRLDRLTRYLESDAHAQEGEDQFSIALLGDSTHYIALQRAYQMPAQFRRQFPEDLRSRTEIFGMNMLGFDAHDYYRLAGWLVDQDVNMIVVPVNLRSFSPVWSDLQTVSYPRLMRHVRWEEIPRAAALTDDTHEYRWDLILLRKLDFKFFDEDMGFYFQGLKKAFRENRDELDAKVLARFSDVATPIPPARLSAKERAKLSPELRAKLNPAIQYPQSISQDHSTMKAFLELGRLARKHDVQIVYYTVQPNPLQDGEVKHFPFVREVLREQPNIHFIDVIGILGPGHFSLGEHLTKEGMRVLSGRLAEEVGALVRESLDD